MLSFRSPETRHVLELAEQVAAYRPSKPLDREGIAARLSKKCSNEDKLVELNGQRMQGEI